MEAVTELIQSSQSKNINFFEFSSVSPGDLTAVKLFFFFYLIACLALYIVQSVIQPLGCNGFLIKLSIYLYLTKEREDSGYEIALSTEV